ncbi:LysR substrate-binding domain-containing protein [Bradyrhizobium erythrophlei]|uniref:LysR substrate-binding domain-containing protein n=1 Tax=Bradyrhizobium erythrophlei TaxID=1437360 RepID=UPI0009F91C8F
MNGKIRREARRSGPPPSRSWMLAGWTLWHEDGEEAHIDFTPRLAFGDLQVLLEATLDGAGIALLPEIHVREALATRRLVHILPAWRAPDSIVHMVFTSRRGMAPATRAFVECAAKELRPKFSADEDRVRL